MWKVLQAVQSKAEDKRIRIRVRSFLQYGDRKWRKSQLSFIKQDRVCRNTEAVRQSQERIAQGGKIDSLRLFGSIEENLDGFLIRAALR